jgi:hypothetical protein
MLCQDERSAAPLEAPAVTLEHRLADLLLIQRELVVPGCDHGAGREPDQISGVGERPGLVEVVHSPDQSPFGVAPGAEVFDVQVSHRQYLPRLGEIGADHRPVLRPPEKCRP